MKKLNFALLVAATFSLAGCGTPKSVLNQANHGIALTSQMELELKEFRRKEANSEKFMVNSVAVQQVFVAGQVTNFKEMDLARQAVGDAATQRIIDNLNAYLRGLAESDAAAADAAKTSSRTLAALLAPLPSTAAATADTQAKFAELGKELPWSVRKTEFETLADTIRTNIKDNKKKIADAKEKVPAPATPTPAPTPTP